VLLMGSALVMVAGVFSLFGVDSAALAAAQALVQ
jgi:hypothetical protein